MNARPTITKIPAPVKGENSELPPHCERTEQAILGCIMIADGEADSFLGQLPRGYFYRESHALIFDALVALRAAGKSLNTLNVKAALEEAGTLAKVGGFGVISELPDRAPAPSVFPEIADTLRKYWIRRMVKQVLATANRIADDPTADAANLVADLESSLRSLLADSSPRLLPEIKDAAALVSKRPEAPAELIYGILHRGSKLVLGGSSKANKTWCLLDLAIAVASGEPWLSWKTVKARVLYVNLELPEWSIAHRVEAVAHAKNISIARQVLDIWNLRGHSASFDVLLPKIQTRIAEAGYSLIILDPIYKLLGTLDENKAGDIGRVCNEVERLASRSGAAVAFAAHFAKGNASSKESIDRISGSGVFARDPDSILVMTRHETDGAFTVDATLRNFKPIEPFVVRWDYPLMRRDENLDPAKLKQPAKGGRSAAYHVAMLLDFLPKRGASTSAWQKRMADETGMSRSKFFELLKEVQKNGNVQNQKGKWIPTK